MHSISYNKIWIRILMTMGIFWIMSNLNLFYSNAKGNFSTQKPQGFMVTAVENKVVLSWEPVKNARGYSIFEKKQDGKYYLRKQTKACRVILLNREKGSSYCYYIRAYKQKKNMGKIYSKPSKKQSITFSLRGISTIKNFLQIAVAPVGSTMYVWGGGWNQSDTAAGKEAKHIGLSPRWRQFSKNKKASYQYTNYRYQIHDGLDCSGYVGWCIYNVLNTKNGEDGYVFDASKQAKKFSNLGFGRYTERSKIVNYKAGDIMSSTCSCCGHVWIVVGECTDKSVVLLHSSPAGVQISGTSTPAGKKNSQAYQLAKKYMNKYYRNWYRKFPDVNRGSSYLSHYAQMRWKTTGKNIILSDPDGYQNMDAEDILKDLFQES